MSDVKDKSKAFWVKCQKCAHCWAAGYYPAEAGLFAQITRKAPCPKCGDTKPIVAKQNNGVLMEPHPDGGSDA